MVCVCTCLCVYVFACVYVCVFACVCIWVIVCVFVLCVYVCFFRFVCCESCSGSEDEKHKHGPRWYANSSYSSTGAFSANLQLNTLIRFLSPYRLLVMRTVACPACVSSHDTWQSDSSNQSTVDELIFPSHTLYTHIYADTQHIYTHTHTHTHTHHSHTHTHSSLNRVYRSSSRKQLMSHNIRLSHTHQ